MESSGEKNEIKSRGGERKKIGGQEKNGKKIERERKSVNTATIFIFVCVLQTNTKHEKKNAIKYIWSKKVKVQSIPHSILGSGGRTRPSPCK